ncbi:MAG: hypothetical protein UT81_C0023G0002 [Parcubacteria group bacterium GW2011_GWA2_40_14]|nr:MAG: hypothetical protein UT81_C0023G0002 [Parcubacteria group bacterium GW2011_GWA2_40_14]
MRRKSINIGVGVRGNIWSDSGILSYNLTSATPDLKTLFVVGIILPSQAYLPTGCVASLQVGGGDWHRNHAPAISLVPSSPRYATGSDSAFSKFSIIIIKKESCSVVWHSKRNIGPKICKRWVKTSRRVSGNGRDADRICGSPRKIYITSRSSRRNDTRRKSGRVSGSKSAGHGQSWHACSATTGSCTAIYAAAEPTNAVTGRREIGCSAWNSW